MSDFKTLYQANKYYFEIGRYFGYPECCIAEFIFRVSTGNFPIPARPLDGTGYIPCINCSLKTEEELTKNINTNRDTSLNSFPDETTK